MIPRLQFPTEIESVVRWVEDTDPDAIIEQSLGKLRDGLAPRELLRAAR